MRYLIVISLLISACGINGEQKFTQQGDSNTNIKVVFEFINQVQRLCEMETLDSDYESKALHDKAVAQCTFSRLSTINLGGICNTPGLTPEQLATCQGLNP
jgi:hypothetical protein